MKRRWRYFTKAKTRGKFRTVREVLQMTDKLAIYWPYEFVQIN